ncbi:MAG: peroxiredoxin [Deltaproteobacteria bacterium]|nr:MAG: peroxiredoxin [Deltaproteobacteria bacterium]
MPIVTNPAPDFEAEAVVDGDFKTIKLSDYRGKWVYLFFYPLDFTFVCPTEIIAFSEAAKQFEALGTQILGCSIDSKFVHLQWIKTPRAEGGLGGINFPLISDINKDISRAYDVLIDAGVALRGSFIIDPNGIVRHAGINDLPVGRSVKEALRLIKAFQYTDEHGEVCPADWEDGADTIVPDPEKAKEYFSKHG